MTARRPIIAWCLLTGVSALAMGCGLVRTPEQYHSATQAVLATRSDAIKTCYDGVIKDAESAKGKVTVTFVVATETGVLSDVKVTENSTGADGVGSCIVEAIDGLSIAPPDVRQGEATYTFEFEIAPRMRRTRDGGLEPADAPPAEPNG